MTTTTKFTAKVFSVILASGLLAQLAPMAEAASWKRSSDTQVSTKGSWKKTTDVTTTDTSTTDASTATDTSTTTTTVADTSTSGTTTIEEQTVAVDISITFQPVSQYVSVNNLTTLNVSATGSGTLSYQWRKDGVAIPDAVMSYYDISAATMDDQGSYDVIVSNTTGSVISNSAQVTVFVDRTANMFWQPPTTREDGSALALEDISGYRIYVTNDAGSLEATYDVPAGQYYHYFDNLETGTHYFTITAIDTSGMESDFSELMSKTIF
ncbi:immunoglobulin domain-containing protein [Hahella aquimaris]|uniref:immunoglobulin domain-containing protein n=1 Tax=Hahella sp. HNIBRBA332 TaxID=3015983 RepID=UPI00273B0616|nr:immunoglobulin domain-containing protein [Hahella sp. HNIBRBA332]WLQ11634.1 immunoglobulin domain-containing protein [Hahella sp. HNIBRBA332]